MSTPLAGFQQLVDGTRPPPPIADLIGFTLSAISPGQAVIDLAAGPQHANPMGALHGGVLCDIGDATMGLAYASTLADGEFLKPVWKAKLRPVGRLVKRGQTLGFVECDITDEQQSLVARASSTWMTLRGEQAERR